jgi:hypothetical protein
MQVSETEVSAVVSAETVAAGCTVTRHGYTQKRMFGEHVGEQPVNTSSGVCTGIHDGGIQ